MPIVRFDGARVACELGDNLRTVLLNAGLPLYHKFAKKFNCRGLGTCGTCAVKLRGSASWPTKIETLRMRLPPHDSEAGLRLACQCIVHGDLYVEKFGGVWGHDLGNPVFLQHPPHTHRPRNEHARHRHALADAILLDVNRPRIRSQHTRRRAGKVRHRTVASMSPLPRANAAKLRQRYLIKRRWIKRT